MKNVLKIIFVIIGTLIGAGFASGQEMYIFFFSYGMKGIYGIIISSVLIGIIIYQALNVIYSKKINTYKGFLEELINNKKIKNTTNSIINVFILATFYIMIAGFGAYVEQEFNMPSIYGSITLSIFCFIIFLNKINGFVKANELLIPALIFVLIIIGITNISDINLKNISNYVIQINNSNWLISSVLYASYNSILMIPILVAMKNFIDKKQNISKIAMISSTIIFILSIIVYSFLIRIDVDIEKLEMPAIYAMHSIHPIYRRIYGLIILISIFTTSISAGTSFLNNTVKSTKTYKYISIIVCLTAILFSRVGFSKLVNLIYPIFGYLGLIQIFLILIKNIAKKREN